MREGMSRSNCRVLTATVRDSSGKISGYVSVQRDITMRRQAEAGPLYRTSILLPGGLRFPAAGPVGGSGRFTISPDGRRIVTGSSDHTAKVWEVSSGNPLFTLTGHTDGVQSVAFSPDGRYVLSGGSEQATRLWDRKTGEQIREFIGGGSGTMAAAYFIGHASQGFWPVNNGGDAAILYCFVFLYIAARGAGRWSVDRK